jgi:aldose 1-epimerase
MVLRMDDTTRPGQIPSGTQWSISAEGQEAVVVEVGGGVRTYRADAEILHGYGADEICPGGAGQILAPWPNRIRDGKYAFGGAVHQLPITEPARYNAIHGLVRWARWRCVDSRADSVTVEYEPVPQPGFPWPLRLRTTWSVDANGLRAEHEAINLGMQPAPFGLASHPYVRVGDVAVDELLLHIPGRSRLLVDSRLLPIGAAKVAGTEFDFSTPRRIGTLVLDAAFSDIERDGTGRSTVQLSTVDGIGVEVWADAAFNWWQVFTGDTLPADRKRRSVAIEPMTCPPDAFRSGRDVVTLAPGQVWRGAWGIRPLVR